MIGTIYVYGKTDYGYTQGGEPFYTVDLPEARVQQTEMFQQPHVIVGSYMRAEGTLVTDADHDNAWLVRAEVLQTKLQFMHAGGYIISGILNGGLYAYPDDAVPWEDGDPCPHWQKYACGGPHAIIDKYTPPGVADTHGRFVEIRIWEDHEACTPRAMT